MASGAPYVELRAHTAFSFGEGAVSPERLAERAAELGYPALGVTDCADLGGVVRFAVACREHGVRPVVGVELIVDRHPLALLARTAAGYRHLAALVTRARAGRVDAWARENAGAHAGTPPRGRPRVAWRDVAERAGGVTLLTGPTTGRLAALLRRGRRDEARRTLAEWRDVFGAHLAVEVQHHYAGRTEEALAGALVELAERAGVPWVVTNDPRYVDAAGRRAHDVLVALRHGCTVDEAAARGLLLPNGEWRLHEPETMAERWAGREEGLERSAEIAEACRFERAWVRPPLPAFPIPAGADADAYLRTKVREGAHRRWGDALTEGQRDQLEHELQVIAGLEFAGFFLVMWDAVQEARRRNIMCQGRGSAANSAVNFCLEVTAVDPVKHGLLFERFLSPKRADGTADPPDIDVDIEHDRREEILDYVYAKYGRAHAAIAAVTQRYSASTAVQDVCRAYGVPVEQAFALSKRVHRLEAGEGMEALRGGLAAAFGVDVTTPRGKEMLRAIAAFDRLPRMRSTHPGGFVLSAAPLGDYCPIEPTTMGRTVLQFDKDDLDDVGIPKFDFLGLGALSVVRHAFDAVQGRGEPRPELYALPQDDPETFAMIARGDTVGTFQIESRAQISSLVHTRPSEMYDLVVQVALIRPGPVVAGFVKPYIERRHKRQDVTYPGGIVDDEIVKILGRTQGLPIFQEQAMRLVRHVARYSDEEADELRRTMGHSRKQHRLSAELEKLRVRLVKERLPPEVADALVDELRGFGNYGFPESHAWSFALIAYATAWLKAHRPAAFYLGLLNAQPMGFYSVATLIHDARRRGVEVRLPCLRGGADVCTLEEADDPARPALRVGWRHARGLGDRAREALAAARAAAPFAGIADAVRRAALARADATALARAHAFAAWEPDRRRAAWEALRAVGDVLPLAPAPRASADAFAPRPLDPHEAVAADYHAVGLSVAGHPMERYRAWCRRVGILDSAQLAACAGQGERVVVAGLVLVRQRPATAKGTMFLLLEDELGTAQVIVHPRVDAAFREVLRHSSVLAVYGRAERDGGKGGVFVNVIARRIEAVDPKGADRLAHRSYDFR